MRAARLGLALLVALALAGCTRGIPVRANVLYPARIPVRAFPSIWIAGSSLPELDFVERLRVHLAKDGQREVRRIELQELEPLRAAGAISPLTVVVTVEPSIRADVQASVDYVPVEYCTFVGCYSDLTPIASTQRQVLGELVLTVYDGPSARVLQTDTFQAEMLAPNSERVRKRVAEQLAWELERAVDVLQTERQFQLEDVDEPADARAGGERIAEGDWQAGRALLERAATQLAGLSGRAQARVWYNLALARWHAPGAAGLTRPAYESARRALELAIAGSGSKRYLTTLKRLEQARQRQAVLEQQRSATAYNFQLKAAMPAAQ